MVYSLKRSIKFSILVMLLSFLACSSRPRHIIVPRQIDAKAVKEEVKLKEDNPAPSPLVEVNEVCLDERGQSPINLKWSAPQPAPKVEFNYQASNFQIANTGTLLELKFLKDQSVRREGDIFNLKYIHFHLPSEHTLSGRPFVLEVQMVHQSDDGKHLVLASFFKTEEKSSDWDQLLPEIPSEAKKMQLSSREISPSVFLPEVKTHYSYIGSLTKAPCTKGVQWMVFNTPGKITSTQLALLKSYYFGNNRKIQDSSDREVKNH